MGDEHGWKLFHMITNANILWLYISEGKVAKTFKMEVSAKDLKDSMPHLRNVSTHYVATDFIQMAIKSVVTKKIIFPYKHCN